jgi:hypothetical protein
MLDVPGMNLRETLFRVILPIDGGNVVIAWHVVMSPLIIALLSLNSV